MHEFRIQNLEATVAQQQRDYDELNQVVIDQARQIEALQREVRHLAASLTAISEHLGLVRK